MILLDTNVISEQFRAVPDETVIDWLNRQPLDLESMRRNWRRDHDRMGGIRHDISGLPHNCVE